MTQRYETYKDSGVQWLGEIPGHWGGTTMGRIISSPLQYGASESGDSIAHVGDWRYIRITDITLDGKLKNEGQKYLPQRIAELYPLEVGDLLFARSGATVGKSYLFNESINACFAGYLIKARINKSIATPEFVSLFTKSAQYDEWKNRIFIQATIQNIGADKYSRLFIPLPPLSEQQAIVSYLDTKCGQIDKMLDGKQKQIELLQEMKQRVIADAVTRGLNSDVKMKATNIPWLPEIPEHWELIRNKVFLTATTDKVGDRKDIILLSLTKQGVIVRDLSEGKGKFPKDFDTYLVVRPDNLVFCLFDMDETPRTVGLVHNEGMLTGAYTNFEVNKSIVLPEYAYCYYLQIDNIKGLRPYYTGLRKVVKTNTFLQIRMPVPPLSEQQAIVSYIQERTTKIDLLASKLQQEIDNIKEYKQRLISDVVTGQIKVC